MEREYDGDGPVRYTDGSVPRSGDIVDASPWCKGQVVAVIETSDYLDDSYRSFSYLGGGLMVLDPELGLIAILDDKKAVKLVSRGL